VEPEPLLLPEPVLPDVPLLMSPVEDVPFLLFFDFLPLVEPLSEEPLDMLLLPLEPFIVPEPEPEPLPDCPTPELLPD
jgi:hypothetical protein